MVSSALTKYASLPLFECNDHGCPHGANAMSCEMRTPCLLLASRERLLHVLGDDLVAMRTERFVVVESGRGLLTVGVASRAAILQL